MNIFAAIILTTLILDYLLNFSAGALNLKTLSKDLPEEFRGVYDAQTYRRSQEYTRAHTRFGFITSSLSLTGMLIFWFGGGFNLLDHFIRGWKLGPVWTGLAYIGILVLLTALLRLPFRIYATFVIEERFGFNQTSPVTFMTDVLKGMALAVVLGGSLLAALLMLFQYGGTFAWLYCWGATTLFYLFTQYVAPSWIMPIFYKFKRLEQGNLKEGILKYLESVHFPVKGIFIIDGSRRSRKTNAFFTGFGRNKRIALYDTLVAKHPVPELIAVLAHEIGHYKFRHVTQGMMMSILHSGIVFFLLSLFLSQQGLYQAFYMKQPSVYAGFIFFGMLYSPIELFLSILMNSISRKNEFQADCFAAETIENPETMVRALKGLSLDNLTNLTPHPFYVFLHYSHPPVLNRIRRILSVELSKQRPPKKNQEQFVKGTA